jgi:NADP-dependent 3-hydroxy acid dehydrogenase YdfG
MSPILIPSLRLLIARTFQTIDILINNAGIAAFGKFLELEPKAWERIIQVNLMGTYYTTRAVLPNMIARNGRYHKHFLDCRIEMH